MGYQAATVAPPYTQPSAAALFPSRKILLPTALACSTLRSIDGKCEAA